MPKAGGGGCKETMVNVGLCTVGCDAGTLVFEMTMMAGMEALTPPTYSATCDISAFSDQGSCYIAAARGARLAGDWDALCECPGGRRPTVTINVPEIYTPSTCTNNA